MHKPISMSLYEYCTKNDLQYLLDEYNRQANISPFEIGFKSTVKVAWECQYGHVEIESPCNRVRRGYCKICGKRMSGSLGQTHPELISLWSEKNECSIFEVPPNTMQVYLWNCNKGHEWSRGVVEQINSVSPCPICRVETTFFELFPELLQEWDYERNEMDPARLEPMSNKVMWWKCKNGHSFSASAAERNRRHKSCPICKSLGFLRPDIAAEWHPTKNEGKTPFDYLLYSNKYAWFVCSVCGAEYRQMISVRIKRERPGCKMCRSD